MREYRFKRGYKASEERLAELLKKHFGRYWKDGNFYVVRNFGAIEELRLKIEGGKLYASTKTRMVDDDVAATTIKTYNRFLEELTGYTAKERQKMLKKEVEGG